MLPPVQLPGCIAGSLKNALMPEINLSDTIERIASSIAKFQECGNVNRRPPPSGTLSELHYLNFKAD